jgi:DNA-directed RNA polymerase specialized sigma24 family protein
MAGDDLSFSELVERARRGDQDAARWLVERYESAVRRQVRFSLMSNRLKRVLDETDVCQSVIGQFFVGLWSGRFELEGPEQLVALLREMVRNKLTDQARYWNAARRDYHRNVGQLDDDAPKAEPPSAEPSPSRIVAGAELLAEFEGRLSDDERAMLALRRQGKSWAEVSDALSAPGAQAVRKRYERAVDRVARELGLRDSD